MRADPAVQTAVPSEDEGVSAEVAERAEVLDAIEQEKVELRRALDDLQQAVVARPKEELSRNAFGVLGGGFLAGFLFALWTARRAPIAPPIVAGKR